MPKLVDHDARRQELGEAVLTLLATEGADRLTLRSVAAEAGWSVGVVQHYFRDREELMTFANELAMARAEGRMRAIMAESPAPLQALRLILAEALPIDRHRREESAAWLAFWTRALTEPDLAARQAAYYKAWRKAVRDLVRDAAATGRLRDDIDLAFEAEALVAFVDGLALQALIEPKRLGPAALGRMLDRAVARLAGGG